MFDILIIGILALFSAILGIDSINKWKDSGQLGYIITALVSILAAIIFVIDLSSGFYVLALAMIIRVVVVFTSRGRKPEPVDKARNIEEDLDAS